MSGLAFVFGTSVIATLKHRALGQVDYELGVRMIAGTTGGIGSFLYAQSGGVELSIVAPLLAGSALGARVGSAAISIVDDDEIKQYFGYMLLGGAIAVAFRQVGNAYGVPVLTDVSLALILGSALIVSGAAVDSSVKNLRDGRAADATRAD